MSGWPVYNHIGGKVPMTRQDAIDEAVLYCSRRYDGLFSHIVTYMENSYVNVLHAFSLVVRREFSKIIMESDTEKHFFRNMTVAERVAITGV